MGNLGEDGSVISLQKYATLFWAEIYAILSCAYEIQMNARQGKYDSIPSDSKVALKALKSKRQSVPVTSPVVTQRVGRGISPPFHDLGTRRGLVVSSTLRPYFTP